MTSESSPERSGRGGGDGKEHSATQSSGGLKTRRMESPAQRRTTRVLVAIMDDVYDFLGFTTEIGEDFEDHKLPTLDIKIWIKDGLIEYEFYEKPMGANIVLHAKTALSEQTKLSSLTQEVVRRLLHTSRRLESTRRLERGSPLPQ